MKRHLITLGFFLLAIACYVVGAAGPATAFIVLGLLAEGIFWFRMLGGRGNRRPD